MRVGASRVEAAHSLGRLSGAVEGQKLVNRLVTDSGDVIVPSPESVADNEEVRPQDVMKPVA